MYNNKTFTITYYFFLKVIILNSLKKRLELTSF